MPRIIVERDLTADHTFESLQAAEDAVAWCLEEHQVQFIRSYYSSDKTRMICEYEAPDAEAVRTTQRVGGLPVARIWAARVFEWENT